MTEQEMDYCLMVGPTHFDVPEMWDEDARQGGRPSGQFEARKTIVLNLIREGHVHLSDQQIADQVGVGPRQIRRLLTALVEDRRILIETHRYNLGGGSWSNRRTIHIVEGV